MIACEYGFLGCNELQLTSSETAEVSATRERISALASGDDLPEPQPRTGAIPRVSLGSAFAWSPAGAENGSYYGELNKNGVPKTVHVNGYFRSNGTYVRGYYPECAWYKPALSLDSVHHMIVFESSERSRAISKESTNGMNERFGVPADVAECLDRGKGELLEAAERQAVSALAGELAGHLALTEKAFNLIGVAVSSLPEVVVRDLSQSRKVVTALLVRLSNDLRSAVLLAVRGYALQAATLVASMYETAYTIAAVGSNDNLADDWINHDDPTKPFRQVQDLTSAGLVKLGVPNADAQAKIEYRTYRQLCLAKHVNPLLTDPAWLPHGREKYRSP